MPGRDFGRIVLELSLPFISAPYSERCRRHYFISSMICCRSSRMGGMGSRVSCTSPLGPFRATMLNFAALLIFGRKIVAEMSAAAFLSFQRGTRHDF